MEPVLLSIHVVAGIVFVGGSAIATSLFPRYVPVLGQEGAGERDRAVATALHRVTRGYSVAALVVPVAGIVLALVQGRVGEIWITLAMVLTAAAGFLLAVQIYPRQRAALAAPGERDRLRPLSMLAGVYNVLWTVVVVLMIVRPGSAEGA
ncbi:hypothetical protein FAF44_22235 [Nonomuraea sp. MG754425]|uniref:hypothetical protein n=1 Tax=Nonomuraea sp. MG754425 TaxID=2570319 RepID=UPI001F361D3B|nr:hypothetical protein [Nonomuraea sp. MG754425]MCF6471097.1 hypothetical protein [Nonomuraea sp. MG754425]